MYLNKTTKITYNAMFVLFSLMLGLLGRMSIFPAFPYLTLDFSDIPVFIATLISGIPSGIFVLFTESLIRALLFSTTSWIGFAIRMTSIIMILFIGYFCKENSKIFKKILGVSFGIILCVALKLAINLFFWPNFFFISEKIINQYFFIFIVPYNIVKLVLTSASALLLIKPVKSIIKITHM